MEDDKELCPRCDADMSAYVLQDQGMCDRCAAEIEMASC